MGYQTFHDALDENQAEREGIDSTQPLGRVHNLYKTGDADAPSVIKDGNGEVVLGLCRDCGKGEIELNGPCVETTEAALPKRVRHLKTGGTYRVLGTGRMQTSAWFSSESGAGMRSADMQEVVIYESEANGSRWARPYSEFMDGRFEALPFEPDLPLTDQIEKDVQEQLSFEAIRSQPSGHELRIGYIQKTAARIARKAALAVAAERGTGTEIKPGEPTAQDQVRINFSGAKGSGKTLLSDRVMRFLSNRGLKVSRHMSSDRRRGMTDDQMRDEIMVENPVETLLKPLPDDRPDHDMILVDDQWYIPVTGRMLAAFYRPEVALTEEQCFMIEAAEQIADIETIDDDARTYVVTREQIVKLMTTVRDKTREYERHPIDDLKGYIESAVIAKSVNHRPAGKPDNWIRPSDAIQIAHEAATLAVRERIEPFKLNEFIDDEMATLNARFAGLPHWQEQKFIEQEVAELCREVALRVIFDKETLLDTLAQDCHAASASAGWWTDLKTGEDLRGKRNKGELMMLMVSEIAEAMEGARKDLASDKLPGFSSEEEELADLFIRLGDYAGAHKLRLGAAVIAKMRYNQNREDHKIENRRKAGGKAW